jgi:hypothetical protein
VEEEVVVVEVVVMEVMEEEVVERVQEFKREGVGGHAGE